MASPKGNKRRSTFGGVVYNTTTDLINIWSLINFFSLRAGAFRQGHAFIGEALIHSLEPTLMMAMIAPRYDDYGDNENVIQATWVFSISASDFRKFIACSKCSVARRKLKCEGIILREGERGREVFRPAFSPISSCSFFPLAIFFTGFYY